MRLIIALCLSSTALLAQRPEFVRIPAGSFGEVRFEQPFWMGKTEVTVRQFTAFVKAAGYRTTAERSNAPRTWKTPGFGVSGNQPVVYVTVRDAAAYCEWVGARLPSDAEWEYAARAGADTRHYWGDTIDEKYLWYRANSGGKPRAVGTRLPNRWGLYDIEGNVWEWTMSDPVTGEPMANRRGGSWVDCADFDPEPGEPASPLIGLSKGYKIPVAYDHPYDDIGFRCARDEK